MPRGLSSSTVQHVSLLASLQSWEQKLRWQDAKRSGVPQVRSVVREIVECGHDSQKALIVCVIPRRVVHYDVTSFFTWPVPTLVSHP